jgi:tetratricopeptide (TPR) repeat protein
MSRRIGLTLLILAVLLLGVWRWREHYRWHPPASARIVLVAAGPASPQCGLDPEEIRVLDVLLDDTLECFGQCSVIRVPGLPAPADWSPGPEGYILHLLPERQGQNLALHFELGKASEARQGLPLRRHAAPALPPAEAFQWLRRQLPSHPDSDGGRIVPTDPEEFWRLVRAYAASRHSDAAMADLRAGTEKNPRCASWCAALSFAYFYAAQNGPLPAGVSAETLERCLREAQARAPGHPRTMSALVVYLVDRGASRQAMVELQEARQRCPRSARLLASTEYVARYSGAFALAQAADAESFRRALGARKTGLVRLSMLYAGDVEGFAQSLRPGIDLRFVGSLDFHRGYLAALQGRVPEALAHFQTAEASTRITEPERRLSAAYRLALMGDAAGARATLDEMAAHRAQFTMPDGEFLFRLAEGYALNGDSAPALELANQAYLHGFGCTRWFETSPFLASMRQGPRWIALHQHLQERQALLEGQLRPSAWNL